MSVDLIGLYKSLDNHMKDFRNHLKEIEELNNNFRTFKRFTSNTGRYTLSIQASKHHYCNPRETLMDVHQYESFEVALIDGKTGLFISFKEIGYDDINLECEFEGDIYGYVDVEYLQNAYRYFINYREE